MNNPSMDYAAQFLISEANGTLSRDQATLLGLNDGATILPPATVLGVITAGAATWAPAAGNIGNGVFGSITLGFGAKPGAYSLQCVAPGAEATFLLIDPVGNELGEVRAGTAFNGPLAFTLTSGSSAFAIGDTLTINIAIGSEKYVAWDPSGTDGRENAAAILITRADVSGAADAQAAVIARFAEVKNLLLNWKSGATSGQIAMATSQLARNGIIVRATQA
jgi:hypothetical protein